MNNKSFWKKRLSILLSAAMLSTNLLPAMQNTVYADVAENGTVNEIVNVHSYDQHQWGEPQVSVDYEYIFKECLTCGYVEKQKHEHNFWHSTYLNTRSAVWVDILDCDECGLLVNEKNDVLDKAVAFDEEGKAEVSLAPREFALIRFDIPDSVHEISIHSESDEDTYGTLFRYNNSSLELVNQDDDGYTGYNFCLSQDLSGGTYILQVKFLDSDTSGVIPVYMEDHGSYCERYGHYLETDYEYNRNENVVYFHESCDRCDYVNDWSEEHEEHLWDMIEVTDDYAFITYKCRYCGDVETRSHEHHMGTSYYVNTGSAMYVKQRNCQICSYGYEEKSGYIIDEAVSFDETDRAEITLEPVDSGWILFDIERTVGGEGYIDIYSTSDANTVGTIYRYDGSSLHLVELDEDDNRGDDGNFRIEKFFPEGTYLLQVRYANPDRTGTISVVRDRSHCEAYGHSWYGIEISDDYSNILLGCLYCGEEMLQKHEHNLKESGCYANSGSAVYVSWKTCDECYYSTPSKWINVMDEAITPDEEGYAGVTLNGTDKGWIYLDLPEEGYVNIYSDSSYDTALSVYEILDDEMYYLAGGDSGGDGENFYVTTYLYGGQYILDVCCYDLDGIDTIPVYILVKSECEQYGHDLITDYQYDSDAQVLVCHEYCVRCDYSHEWTEAHEHTIRTSCYINTGSAMYIKQDYCRGCDYSKSEESYILDIAGRFDENGRTDISLGAGEYGWTIFEVDGAYKYIGIESDPDSDLDTYATLYRYENSSLTYITENDDGGIDGNFRISTGLPEGTYLLVSRFWSSGESGTFSVLMNSSESYCELYGHDISRSHEYDEVENKVLYHEYCHYCDYTNDWSEEHEEHEWHIDEIAPDYNSISYVCKYCGAYETRAHEHNLEDHGYYLNSGSAVYVSRKYCPDCGYINDDEHIIINEHSTSFDENGYAELVLKDEERGWISFEVSEPGYVDLRSVSDYDTYARLYRIRWGFVDFIKASHAGNEDDNFDIGTYLDAGQYLLEVKCFDLSGTGSIPVYKKTSDNQCDTSGHAFDVTKHYDEEAGALVITRSCYVCGYVDETQYDYTHRHELFGPVKNEFDDTNEYVYFACVYCDYLKQITVTDMAINSEVAGSFDEENDRYCYKLNVTEETDIAVSTRDINCGINLIDSAFEYCAAEKDSQNAGMHRAIYHCQPGIYYCVLYPHETTENQVFKLGVFDNSSPDSHEHVMFEDQSYITEEAIRANNRVEIVEACLYCPLERGTGEYHDYSGPQVVKMNGPDLLGHEYYCKHCQKWNTFSISNTNFSIRANETITADWNHDATVYIEGVPEGNGHISLSSANRFDYTLFEFGEDSEIAVRSESNCKQVDFDFEFSPYKQYYVLLNASDDYYGNKQVTVSLYDYEGESERHEYYYYIDLDEYDDSYPFVDEGSSLTLRAIIRDVCHSTNIQDSDYTYHWYKDGSLIPDAHDAAYEISSMKDGDYGKYSVKIDEIPVFSSFYRSLNSIIFKNPSERLFVQISGPHYAEIGDVITLKAILTDYQGNPVENYDDYVFSWVGRGEGYWEHCFDSEAGNNTYTFTYSEKIEDLSFSCDVYQGRIDSYSYAGASDYYNPHHIWDITAGVPAISIEKAGYTLAADLYEPESAGQYGFVYSDDDAEPTLETAGRANIVFTDHNNGEISLNTFGAPSGYYRAYEIINKPDNSQMTLYSDPQYVQ